MMSTAKKILEEALALPADERAALADALNQSLSHSADLSPAWKAEIASRIEAVERGESRLVPGDEVAARVRAALTVR